jgi:hypothetical protein
MGATSPRIRVQETGCGGYCTLNRKKAALSNEHLNVINVPARGVQIREVVAHESEL